MRERDHMTTMMYKLPVRLKEEIEKVAELNKISASELVRRAVREYLEFDERVKIENIPKAS